jgi:hypothetical protein
VPFGDLLQGLIHRRSAVAIRDRAEPDGTPVFLVYPAPMNTAPMGPGRTGFESKTRSAQDYGRRLNFSHR